MSAVPGAVLPSQARPVRWTRAVVAVKGVHRGEVARPSFHHLRRRATLLAPMALHTRAHCCARMPLAVVGADPPTRDGWPVAHENRLPSSNDVVQDVYPHNRERQHLHSRATEVVRADTGPSPSSCADGRAPRLDL